MIKWYDVPHNLMEIRDRYEALNWRAQDVETVATLRARGTYDPAEHSVLDKEPLTAEEWAELLAYGHAIAKHYAHPAAIDRAVRAGLSWDDVAAAIGQDPAEVRAAYRKWADGQRQLNARLNAREPGSTLGLTAEEHAQALARAAEPAPAARTPEDRRAAAVRALERLGADRADLDQRSRAEVLAARAAGVPVRRVAELTGIAPDTVTRWTEERARELLAEGRTAAEVAAATGAREDTVNKWAAETPRRDTR